MIATLSPKRLATPEAMRWLCAARPAVHTMVSSMQSASAVSRVRAVVNLDRFGAMFGALADNPHYRQYWLGNQANTFRCSPSRWS